jgi:hypothetical protein
MAKGLGYICAFYIEQSRPPTPCFALLLSHDVSIELIVFSNCLHSARITPAVSSRSMKSCGSYPSTAGGCLPSKFSVNSFTTLLPADHSFRRR